jgi:uncharacterized protein (DUF2252 family)
MAEQAVLDKNECRAAGKAKRTTCPRESHGDTGISGGGKRDVVAIGQASDKDRLKNLIPIRNGRMAQSPFAFFRGSAALQAFDLSKTPQSGIEVQACGDCHLSNFGGYATPERRLIFDINDFDETLPAPFEWDVKRLAASFVIASRNNGLSEKRARAAVLACVRSYRERIYEFSEMRALDVWYHRLEADELLDGIKDAEIRNRAKKKLARVKALTALEYDFP